MPQQMYPKVGAILIPVIRWPVIRRTTYVKDFVIMY